MQSLDFIVNFGYIGKTSRLQDNVHSSTVSISILEANVFPVWDFCWLKIEKLIWASLIGNHWLWFWLFQFYEFWREMTLLGCWTNLPNNSACGKIKILSPDTSVESLQIFQFGNHSVKRRFRGINDDDVPSHHTLICNVVTKLKY